MIITRQLALLLICSGLATYAVEHDGNSKFAIKAEMYGKTREFLSLEEYRREAALQDGGQFYVELTNLENRYYSSNFSFGSNSQPISLIIDSQTDWTIVQAKECTDCKGAQRYDRTTSTTTSKSDIFSTVVKLNDGGELHGRTTKDKTCQVAADGTPTCVDAGFNFFEITSIVGIQLAPVYSGILGIAPDDPANGPSFVATLKDQGYIFKKKLGINIQKAPTTSYVTFGGVSEFQMYKKDGGYPIYWYESTDSKRWKTSVQDLLISGIGNTNNDPKNYKTVDPDNEGIKTAIAAIDTFYRAVLIPTAIFENFIKAVDTSFNKTDGSPIKGKVICSDAPKQGNCWVQGMTCEESKSGFRDFVIKMQDKKGFIIPPDSYLLDGTETDGSGKVINYCNILIQRNNIPDHLNEYVLGDVFLYNYYQVLDFEDEKDRIGFNGPIVDFDPNNVDPTNPAEGYPLYIIFIVVGVIAIVGLGICCFIRMRNRKLKAQLTDPAYDQLGPGQVHL